MTAVARIVMLPFLLSVEGTYEGYCPLTEGERYEIVVKAA